MLFMKQLCDSFNFWLTNSHCMLMDTLLLVVFHTLQLLLPVITVQVLLRVTPQIMDIMEANYDASVQ